MSDVDIILYEQVEDGKREALEALYDKYHKLIFSFAYRMVKNKELAEEIVQEVFIKIWTKKGLYQAEKGKFSSWLLTITRNLSIDLIRKQKEVPYELQEEREKVPDGQPLPEDLTIWKEKRAEINQALAELKENQQQIIQLFYFQSCTQVQIATKLDIPLGTVKGRLRLALKHLKDIMVERRKYDE